MHLTDASDSSMAILARLGGGCSWGSGDGRGGHDDGPRLGWRQIVQPYVAKFRRATGDWTVRTNWSIEPEIDCERFVVSTGCRVTGR